jgi:hypothetical protein
VVSYFLRYFSSTSTEQISPDSAGRFTSFDPVGFAIFATLSPGCCNGEAWLMKESDIMGVLVEAKADKKAA